MPINRIIDFSKEIIELGEKNSFQPLIDLGKVVFSAAKRYDIKDIETALSKFNEV